MFDKLLIIGVAIANVDGFPSGEMTILDNVRCQHARDGFEGDMGARHLSTTFMSWDEALCRRRRLQEQFGLF